MTKVMPVLLQQLILLDMYLLPAFAAGFVGDFHINCFDKLPESVNSGRKPYFFTGCINCSRFSTFCFCS